MQPFPPTVSDDELIAYLDRWAALLERGDYDAAFAFTDHQPQLGWTPEQLRVSIDWYGPYDPNRRVTLDCEPTTKTERKVVSYWPEPAGDIVGEVRYGLNIEREASDLFATFLLRRTADGVTLCFQDVDV